MASSCHHLRGFAAATVNAPASPELLLGFQQPLPQKLRPRLSFKQIPPSHFTFNLRLNNIVGFERKLRRFALFASNSNPSRGDSTTEKSDATKLGDTARGPPFLTILAGFLVFFLFCWVFGSIITWLIGLVAK